jgi:uncharacterized LabA/DUF88 family protein
MRNQNAERVMVFIDLRNVINSQFDLTGAYAELDFKTMINVLVGDRNFTGAYMFDGEVRDKGTRLHDIFRTEGFRVIVRDSFDHENGIQKEVDVSMACEILSHAIKDHYDTAIIVTGDRDFRPAVEHIQFEGKKAEIAGFSKGMSGALRRSGDVFHCLDSIPMIRFVTEQPRPMAKDVAVVQEGAVVNA